MSPSLNIKEYVIEAAQYEAVNHKGLKSVSRKAAEPFLCRLKPAGEYYCQQRSVTLLALINLPFSHFHLIKNNYLYSRGLLCSVFLFYFPTIAVISCLLTHRLDVIYRHPNVRPNAVYFSISLRPPEHRHCYRAPWASTMILPDIVQW